KKATHECVGTHMPLPYLLLVSLRPGRALKENPIFIYLRVALFLSFSSLVPRHFPLFTFLPAGPPVGASTSVPAGGSGAKTSLKRSRSMLFTSPLVSCASLR